MTKWMRQSVAVAVVALAMGQMAWAGPVIIDGTDANDHGSSGGIPTANLSGWLYMQKVLENLAGSVAATVTKTVVNLGADSSSASSAITSAFGLSALPGLGWTLTTVDGGVAIDSWLATLSTSTTGILYIPTRGLTGGDLAPDELTAINGRATEINTFVGGAGTPALGGGLFAMGETGSGAYGWLSTLIPGIVITDAGSGGIGNPISLTAAGNTAFPGLTNADLSSGPWHNYFSGSLGGLSVLGTSPDGAGTTRNIILGGGVGTVIGCGEPGQPPCPENAVPEPASMLLFGIGGLAAGFSRMRKFFTV